MARFRFVVGLWLVIILELQGQTLYDHVRTGDIAIAEKYVAWAQSAITEGRWAQALAGLERARDFSHVSSDIWYLLALTRSHEHKPTGAVLQAVQMALETNQWRNYTPVSARLLEAETLLQIRRYSEALHRLSALPQSVDSLCLKLLALKGLGDRQGFGKLIAQGMAMYPRESKPIRIFFEYAADRLPIGSELELISLALERLPFLNQNDPQLAYLSVPFIWNVEDARRNLEAYRAAHGTDRAALPALLDLGLINGRDAVDELFTSSPGRENILDKNLLLAVWNLLRTDEDKDRFQEQVLRFSGIITEDADKDGYSESHVRYQNGTIVEYAYDADQDNLSELTIFFESGIPVRAEVVLAPEASGEGNGFASPVKDADRLKGIVQWEQYPAVLQTEVRGTFYKPRPLDFFFFPVHFKRLESGGLLYPERDSRMPGISERRLIASSLLIERPSRNFTGAMEHIELHQGVPQKAQEFFKGRLVSETDFHLGKPIMQRLDLDMNGYLETVRHFLETGNSTVIESSDSDWDEDGFFEYKEQYSYRNDDAVQDVRLLSWDIDRDGVREFFDTIIFRSE